MQALKKDLLTPLDFYSGDSRRHFWVVLNDQRQVVGCAAVCESPKGDSALEFRRLAVATGFRRRGIAKKLVRAAQAFAKGASNGDAAFLQLSCLSGEDDPNAIAACSLYEKLGFVKVNERECGSGSEKRTRMLDYTWSE